MATDRKFVAVMPGAEPYSADGGPHGVLVLHGFTGTPQSIRGLAAVFAAEGYAVELPLLPGHGTSVDDLATTTFDDWSGAAAVAYDELAARCDRVVVAGLSMGGLLASWLATRRPGIAGIIVINGGLAPMDPDLRTGVEQLIEQDVTRIPGPGNDIADPSETELAYIDMPTAQLLSLFDAVESLQVEIPRIECPTLLITSEQDHVVPPGSSDVFAANVGGPVERITLTRSFHVATLDYERDVVERASVAFAARVLGGATPT